MNETHIRFDYCLLSLSMYFVILCFFLTIYWLNSLPNGILKLCLLSKLKIHYCKNRKERRQDENGRLEKAESKVEWGISPP